jgi:hypothetical protein
MSAVSAVDMFDLHASIEAAQVKRLQNLERENIRLRKAVSELTLDKLILQEVRANHVAEHNGSIALSGFRASDACNVWGLLLFQERGVLQFSVRFLRTIFRQTANNRDLPIRVKQTGREHDALRNLEIRSRS